MEEKYYLNYDEKTGVIKGFYLKSIHGDNIPTPNIEITTEKHDFFFKNNGLYKINLKTLTEEKIEVKPFQKEPTEQEKINAQILQQNAEMQVQLEEQKQINAQILLQLANLGGSTNV